MYRKLKRISQKNYMSNGINHKFKVSNVEGEHDRKPFSDIFNLLLMCLCQFPDKCKQR